RVETPEQVAASAPEVVGEPLKIAIAAIFEAAQHRTDLEPLRVYLEAGLRRPVEMVVVSDYGATADLLSSGRVPYASLTPALYIKTRASNPEVSLVAGKEHSGTQAADAVLLARLDMEVESAVVQAKELVGKRFCYVDELSTTGYLLPRAWLIGQGLDPDEVFSKTIRSGNHMELIRNLASDVCDVGGTFEEALDRAQENGLDVATVRRIGATGRTPHDAICAGPAADSAVTGRLKELLLSFDPVDVDPDSVEKLTGFWEVFDSEFDNLRKALD
ncbi:MAG: PhnD/SsuA/transferrin family substrate-binding protein, partial [Myxococcota bacterium]|nr:PhnD/SsuA/transferrin family substrate-binding protein [Myxococcota bacterium]